MCFSPTKFGKQAYHSCRRTMIVSAIQIYSQRYDLPQSLHLFHPEPLTYCAFDATISVITSAYTPQLPSPRSKTYSQHQQCSDSKSSACSSGSPVPWSLLQSHSPPTPSASDSSLGPHIAPSCPARSWLHGQARFFARARRLGLRGGRFPVFMRRFEMLVFLPALGEGRGCLALPSN